MSVNGIKGRVSITEGIQSKWERGGGLLWTDGWVGVVKQNKGRWEIHHILLFMYF